MAERKRANNATAANVENTDAIVENTDATENIAETTNNATIGKRVTVKLPRLAGQNAIQEEFFSVNGRNYRIKRGERVEVPEELAEVIENAEKAEEYAMNYVSELVNAENEKKAEFGIK